MKSTIEEFEFPLSDIIDKVDSKIKETWGTEQASWEIIKNQLNSAMSSIVDMRRYNSQSEEPNRSREE